MIRFEHQQYQEECVKNIVSILEGYDFKTNEIDILNSNLEKFYKNNNNIPNKLKNISKKSNKLDVLMETGTGKTFVYLKTIFELNKNFGLNKFIIFVPRKAIREGVLQNIDLTKEFFYSDDGYKKYLSVYTYDGNTCSVNGFVRNKEELSVLILTNSSIDKEKNNLRKKDNETFFNVSMLEKIVETKPILILDEPHLLKGDKFTEIFLETFKDTLYIRFGATFPKDSENGLNNIAYVLDSITSFKNYLVKRIQVNTLQMYGEDFEINKIHGKEISILYSKNDIKYKNNLKINEDIGQKTGLSRYNGVFINTIKKDTIYLSNNTEKSINNYSLNDEEIELMIKTTITIHFEKEEELFCKGIKELSLFFIPNVEDFRGNEPKIKNIFEKKYKEIRKEYYDKTNNKEYKEFLDRDFKNNKLVVAEGYFSGDKGTKDDKEKDGIEKILKHKEKLLSFDEPLRFVFSVWALQEGWDNPNIFNICKLTNSNSDISRRQQVGRGLRLCVNQEGQRITYDYLKQDDSEFKKINTLNVIVSGYEKNFIEEIQHEIVDNSYFVCGDYLEKNNFEKLNFNDTDIHKLFILLENNDILEFINENKYKIKQRNSFNSFVKNNRDKFGFLDDEKYNSLLKITDNDIEKYVKNGNNNNNKLKIVNIKQSKFNDFKVLWEAINRKSRIIYKNLNEDELIDQISAKFNAENINPLSIRCEIKEYDPKTNEIIKTDSNSLDLGDVNFFKDNKYEDYLEFFIKKYTKNFVIKLFNKLDLEKIKNNPKDSKTILDIIIKEEIHSSLINKIDYEIGSEVIIGNKLQDDNGECKQSLNCAELGGENILDRETKENYLFDKVVYDSNIEKDVIVNDFEKIDGDNITVFAKLPRINIPTPYKTYNPDFGYLINRKDREKQLFLIVETKGYDRESDIPSDEKIKIEYAKRFFKKLQESLPNVDIKYTSRIKGEELFDIIKRVFKK